MGTAIDPVLISRLSGEFETLGNQMWALGRDLEALRCQVTSERAGRPAGEPSPGPSAGASAEVDGSARPVQAETRAAAGPGAASGAAGGGGPARPSESAEARGADAAAGAHAWPRVGDVPAPGLVPPAGGAPKAGTVPPPGAYGPGGYPQGAQYPQPGGGYAQPGGRFGQPSSWVPRGAGVRYGVPPGTPGWGAPTGAWRPPKRTPWWQQEGVISRVLAVAGVGVTLIGVVMLLVLAAQAGFFGPVPRLITGVAFSAVLVGAGVRVYGRSGGQVGGIALAATGIAGGYLNVVGVTTVYEWLPPMAGLALASAVAAAGVWLAMRWNSQTLAVLVVAGAAVLSPVVTVELALLGFLIVLQTACVPVQLARNWPILHVIRTAPAVLATLAAIAVATFDTPGRERLYLLLTAAVAIAAVGMVGAVLAVRKRSGDITATVTLAMAATPLLAAPVMFERRTSVLVAALFAAVLLAVAATAVVPNQRTSRFIPPHTAIVAAVAGSFALLEACIGVTNAQTLPIALLLVTLGFLGVAGQQRNAVAAGIGAMFAVLGALVFLDSASPETLAVQRFAEQRLGISTLLAALLALAVVVVGVWAVRRLPGIGGDVADALLWVTGSLAGLYAVTAATVSIGVASGTTDGFLIGHSAATIAWMAAATAALLYGLRKLSRSPAVAKLALGSGLLVSAAALAKLFLFDLATLDGLVRVAAFLIVGVLLLLAGTRYARAFADAGNEDSPAR
ncbi:DUF2339 domain-containing protein [Nocardia cyriacigeorgica]|uniref:DUF2339 domain-containing protein n=1 Tax=Nocardia cyriacigeorgica TaxID=135487 RepID=UPI001E422F84|nr:DUF2339 domain-containing protein [Nocardia cyriacigeorgica]